MRVDFFYPTTLLDLFISFNRWLLLFCGIFRDFYLSAGDRDTFTSSFPTWLPSVSFSRLLALARPSSTVLNRTGESGHRCLVADLRGKASNLSLLSKMLAVVFSYMAFIGLR